MNKQSLYDHLEGFRAAHSAAVIARHYMLDIITRGFQLLHIAAVGHHIAERLVPTRNFLLRLGMLIGDHITLFVVT